MRKKGEAEQNDSITSPMPGKVVKIPVTVGQEMKAGDTVIVIEAMKMQSNYKVTSDYAVVSATVNHQFVQFHKCTFVQQHIDTFAELPTAASKKYWSGKEITSPVTRH